jgi:hypothetical protein
MTFLEFFNTKKHYPFSLTRGEENSKSSRSGSLSNDAVNHRHTRPNPGVDQITSNKKHTDLVPEYLTKHDSLISKCIKTKQDQPISGYDALSVICNNDYRAMPTVNNRIKGIKKTGVCLVLNPDNKTYKLTFRGVQNGKA